MLRVTPRNEEDYEQYNLRIDNVYEVVEADDLNYYITKREERKLIPKHIFVEAVPIKKGIAQECSKWNTSRLIIGKEYLIYAETHDTYFVYDEEEKYYGFYKERFNVIETYATPIEITKSDEIVVPLFDFDKVICGKPYELFHSVHGYANYEYVYVIDESGELHAYLARGFAPLTQLLGGK